MSYLQVQECYALFLFSVKFSFIANTLYAYSCTCIYSLGMKDALNRKDELYNDLIDSYFNKNNLDFPKGTVDEDGGYFVQVLHDILLFQARGSKLQDFLPET